MTGEHEDGEVEAQLDDGELDELLGALTTELVSSERAEPALTQLFATEPGKWVDCETLCAEVPTLRRQFADVRADHGVRVMAMWLDTPAQTGDSGDGWCVVVFYSPEWNGVANTALLDKRSFFATRAS